MVDRCEARDSAERSAPSAPRADTFHPAKEPLQPGWQPNARDTNEPPSVE